MVTDDQGNPVTYAAKWESSDLAGKREMLSQMRITFAWGEERTPIVTMAPLWAVPSEYTTATRRHCQETNRLTVPLLFPRAYFARSDLRSGYYTITR